jgi:hypothetical protein
VKRVKSNKGYHQFINKWGFTSSILTKHILHRGEVFTGNLPEFKMSSLQALKQVFKKWMASFKSLHI